MTIPSVSSSVGRLQALPHGEYIAMNGQYFEWNRVRKNQELGFSEPLADD
jgi:L-asparaginase